MSCDQQSTVLDMTVRTMDQLQWSLEYCAVKAGQNAVNLPHSLRIELFSKKLSDGTVAFEIGIRKEELTP